jgi:hypothetical protein
MFNDKYMFGDEQFYLIVQLYSIVHNENMCAMHLNGGICVH